MSGKTLPGVVAVSSFILDLDGSAPAVTLRVKPDRRQRREFFPSSLDRRVRSLHTASAGPNWEAVGVGFG